MIQVDLMKVPVGSDVLMVDAWGSGHEGCACPSQPRVQEAWIEAVAGVEGSPVELVGLGFRSQGGFFESICFCPACQYGYGAAGGILEQIAREGGDAAHPSVNIMLMWRRSVQYGLLKQMREVARGELWLRTAAELRYTGERSSLTFEECKGLVEACTVVVDDEAERARLLRLGRPMPVYEVVGWEYVPLG